MWTFAAAADVRVEWPHHVRPTGKREEGDLVEPTVVGRGRALAAATFAAAAAAAAKQQINAPKGDARSLGDGIAKRRCTAQTSSFSQVRNL